MASEFEEGYRTALEDLGASFIDSLPTGEQEGIRRMINAFSSALLKQFRKVEE